MTGQNFRFNIALLATAQGLYLVSGVTFIMFSGLVGQNLSDTPLLATLPIAVMTIGTATSTIPMSILMRRIGRRWGFLLGATAGLVAGSLGAYAIVQSSFVLFCMATFIMGIYQASTQYYRFGAVESAPLSFASRAVSLVLLGGVISALFGPSLAVYSQKFLAPVPFAGSFLMSAVISVVAMIPLALVRIPRPLEDACREGARSLRVIVRQPVFIAAVLNAATGYGLMVLVMTTTPLAMIAHGFAMSATGMVIQWHVLAMFVPSFFSGWLIHRLGVLTILFTGMGLFVVSALVATSGLAMINFGVTLVVLGVAWNFMFVGGTTLLIEAYRPSEKAKTQGVNELIVFASAATGSFASGGLFNMSGWDAVNYGVVPFLLVTFSATVWYARQHARQPDCPPIQRSPD